MKKAEQIWKETEEPKLAEFYERWYKQTNEKEYLDKAEQIWKKLDNKTEQALKESDWDWDYNLAKFYERRYEQTNDEKYINKIEQTWKNICRNHIMIPVIIISQNFTNALRDGTNV
jgi:Beta-L-arabinofuranosidase, GH127